MIKNRQAHSFRRFHRFSLVELLVVIAIISVLSGLLLPALQNAMRTVRSLSCLNHLKQVGFGCSGYADTYRDFLPPAFGQSLVPGTVSGVQPGYAYWMAFVGPQIYPDYNCSDMRYGNDRNGWGIAPNWVFNCPNDDWETEPDRSYGINGVAHNGLNAPNGWGAGSGIYGITMVRRSQLSSPSASFMVSDHIAYYMNTNISGTITRWMETVGRHGEGLNFVYADGHAGTLFIPDIPTTYTSFYGYSKP